MKKLIRILIVFGMVGMFFENVIAAEDAIEAISIEQFFDDGKDRTGKIVYVNSPVIELSYDEDPFSDKKEIKSLTRQKGNRKILILLNKNLPSGTLKEGLNATVKFKTGPILGYYTAVPGEVVHGNVKIVKWSSKEKPKLEDSVTVEDYFAKKLRFANKRVTLEGNVVEFSKAGSGEVRIELGASDSNSVQVYIDQRIWKKKEIKDILKTLKEGDRVSIRGKFDMEGGMSVFTGKTLSKK